MEILWAVSTAKNHQESLREIWMRINFGVGEVRGAI
jgi:hypothetical protein